MNIRENLQRLKKEIPPSVQLVAVTKTHAPEIIMQAYHAGHKVFGENRVQELVAKQRHLPKDIEWHLIGHLQTNKVKYIAPFVSMIQSADSMKLLMEINKQAQKFNRVINCLLQIRIAKEETKFGMSFDEARTILLSDEVARMKNICMKGLMGMATLTDDNEQIRQEFRSLKIFYDSLRHLSTINYQLSILSMGMSSDYKIAMGEGSTMLRLGSVIFGERK